MKNIEKTGKAIGDLIFDKVPDPLKSFNEVLGDRRHQLALAKLRSTLADEDLAEYQLLNSILRRLMVSERETSKDVKDMRKFIKDYGHKR